MSELLSRVKIFLRLKQIILLPTLTGFCGCMSTTQLKSTDPQAEIFFSENKKAIGHLEYRDRQTVFGEFEVQVRKPQCQTKYYKISRADEFSPASLVFGALTYGIGLLWITKYYPSYDLKFVCEPLAKASP